VLGLSNIGLARSFNRGRRFIEGSVLQATANTPAEPAPAAAASSSTRYVAAKRVLRVLPPGRPRALGRTGQLIVEHLVRKIQSLFHPQRDCSRKPRLSFLRFPYVCPEPVWVK
jgi:hypothetical protein